MLTVYLGGFTIEDNCFAECPALTAIEIKSSVSTIKDLAFAMFKLGIDAYEKKHGKVVLRGNATKRELF